jgi:predicted GNAT superfamily acetyltransferase
VVVEAVEDVGALQEAVELLCAVWGVDRREPPIRRDMLRALAHAGNYVASATSDGHLVGVIIGFLGRHQGELVLHSHILGVVQAMQGRSVGFALKQHQRWWSLAAGLEHVTWTFDPLVRRNGNFNLNKLGARIEAYHPSFYGPMDDGINAGDETDRCVVWWSLLDEQVVRAAEGGHDEALGDPPLGSAVVLGADSGGWPHLSGEGAAAGGDAETLAAWVPADIVQLRRDDSTKALAWRRALRTVLSGALAGGYRVVGITRPGWYLLEQAGRPR